MDQKTQSEVIRKIRTVKDVMCSRWTGEGVIIVVDRRAGSGDELTNLRKKQGKGQDHMLRRSEQYRSKHMERCVSKKYLKVTLSSDFPMCILLGRRIAKG